MTGSDETQTVQRHHSEYQTEWESRRPYEDSVGQAVAALVKEVDSFS